LTPARILFVDDEQRILDGLRDLLRSLVNLIKNAADALGEAGRRELRLGVAADLAVHRAVCTIADSGSGIAADALAKIFAPFYTTKPDGKGTGLGLPVVKQIVEGYGGTIAVASQVGVGTTFTATLALDDDES